MNGLLDLEKKRSQGNNSMGNLSVLNVGSKLKHSKQTTAPKPTVRAKSNTPGTGCFAFPDLVRYSSKPHQVLAWKQDCTKS